MINNSQHSDREAVDPGAIDSVFDILQERDRRYVLYFLLEHDRVTVQDIANVVTGWVNANSSEMADKDDRDAIATDLRHRHLPVLIESSLVDYDRSTESVSLAPCPEPIRAIIERACSEETGS
ncbi:hypothetical protein [Halostagnicola sp. A-GB9-2]|uniref:DUF7344 domain-containing protein n=1 Tax=Halostagnicola sp. A-GB9-2 TaxID=3048066 RepID=UPI0024C0B45A|nr:hypothetical protein [Halostagnicola sp. A-GB9-2]MDJ1430539.1 hypothetical protein [Halostagnicola sp. A-GB9-2]